MTRGKIVAGNWKMNLDLQTAIDLASSIDPASHPGVEVAIFPSFPWLIPVKEIVDSTNITVGAQNCYIKNSGAFTGEVSPAMVAEICQAVLAGHSERRHVFKESNTLVGEKVAAAIANDLRVFLCVGELLEDREAGETEWVVAEQLQNGLAGIQLEDFTRIVVAYEPVWAIGTGMPATADDAQETCSFIRNWISSRHSVQIAAGMQILYGGSVNGENAEDFFSQEDIDGALIGGACLNAAEFNYIISVAAQSAQV